MTIEKHTGFYGRRYGKAVTEEKYNKIVEKQLRRAVRNEERKNKKEFDMDLSPKFHLFVSGI